jgi:alkylhydroperoxidase family enzyme
MARLPYVEPEKASAELRELLERLPVKLNIFKLMANAETCFRPMLQLGTAVLTRQKLSGKLRELAILRVARLSGAEYEWVQHVPIAKAVGASDEQVAALEAGRADAPCFDATERAVLAFTSELCAAARPSDVAFDELAGHLSPQEIVELVIAIGYYMLIARLMETARIDLDPPAGTRIVEAATQQRR